MRHAWEGSAGTRPRWQTPNPIEIDAPGRGPAQPSSETELCDTFSALCDSEFRVADEIDWGAVVDNTYSLIGETSSLFDGITNFGAGDPFDIGGGRTAYFTNTSESGGLSLVVVPEPSTFALLGGVAAVSIFMMRRRRTAG
jgi:hypothetical protein